MMGNEVKIALRIWIIQIDRRWRDLIPQCQYREDRLDTPCSAEHMTRHGLGRAHGDLIGIITQGRLDRLRFRNITRGR